MDIKDCISCYGKDVNDELIVRLGKTNSIEKSTKNDARTMMGGATMIKKIEKEIKKLEILKEQKINKRNQLDEELSEITTQLKELYSLKNQYEKLQNSTLHFFEKSETS